MENRMTHSSKQLAVMLLQEAVRRIEGEEPIDVWKWIPGLDCDAISLAVKTVEKI